MVASFLLSLPVPEASLPPFREILFGNDSSAEISRQYLAHHRTFVQPGQHLRPRLAVIHPKIGKAGL